MKYISQNIFQWNIILQSNLRSLQSKTYLYISLIVYMAWTCEKCATWWVISSPRKVRNFFLWCLIVILVNVHLLLWSSCQSIAPWTLPGVDSVYIYIFIVEKLNTSCFYSDPDMSCILFTFIAKRLTIVCFYSYTKRIMWWRLVSVRFAGKGWRPWGRWKTTWSVCMGWVNVGIRYL